MVILLYEFTCINLHDKLFYPLRNSKRFNVRSIQFISDFVDRFNVAHCYNWHAIYTSHAVIAPLLLREWTFIVNFWPQGPSVIAIEWAN